MMEVGSWWAVTTACFPEVIIALFFYLHFLSQLALQLQSPHIRATLPGVQSA